MKNIELIIIDPQVSFCDPKDGTLYVPGADDDMNRLAQMIHRIGHKLNRIHVTLDSHRVVDIAHPIWWKDQHGNHPNPFTIITPDDVDNGVWTTVEPSFFKRSSEYVHALHKSGRYPLCIWPEHCLIGTRGQNIIPEVSDALIEWERRFKVVDFITKGSNVFTEHYSAVKAEVPDPSDISTLLNTRLINTLENADMVIWAGEAGSHCLANTFRDTIDAFSDASFINRQYLLLDATSPVPGFESLQDNFVQEMKSKGMNVAYTHDVL